MSIELFNTDDLPPPPTNWLVDDSHNGLIFCGILPEEIEYLIYSFNGQVPPTNKYNIIKNLTLSFNKECLGNELINACIDVRNYNMMAIAHYKENGREMDSEYWRLNRMLDKSVARRDAEYYKMKHIPTKFNKIDALIYPKIKLEGLHIPYNLGSICFNLNNQNKYGYKGSPITIGDLKRIDELEYQVGNGHGITSKREDIDYIDKYKNYRYNTQVNATDDFSYTKERLLEGYLNKQSLYAIKNKKKDLIKTLFELYGEGELFRPKKSNKINLSNLKMKLYPNMDRNVEVSKRLNPHINHSPECLRRSVKFCEDK